MKTLVLRILMIGSLVIFGTGNGFTAAIAQDQPQEQTSEKQPVIQGSPKSDQSESTDESNSISGTTKQSTADSQQEQAADESKKSAEVTNPSDDKKKIETVTAETKHFIAYESFPGVFESTETQEVKTDFKNWSDLVIEFVVEEGTAVSRGDRLLQFDTESIDKAIKEAEFATRNAEFDLQNAELAMKQAKETYELDQALAERTWKNAQEDYEYYLNTRLPQTLDNLKFNEKTADYSLEYSKDELDQLQKMYTADELTEESEAIVLKRAQRDVESTEHYRDRNLTSLKRQKETEIPREKIKEEDLLKREELNYAKSQITLPIAKQKAEIALAQTEFALEEKRKLLTELKAELEKMTLVAPVDGIVYYGHCERGKWTGSRKLEPDMKLSAKTPVVTIVDINQLMIRANLKESSLNSLAPRKHGKALVNAAGNTTIPVIIKSISRIPREDNTFDCQILLEKMAVDSTVMPGMGCKLSFVVHDNSSALVLPKGSVFSDDDGVSNYVYKFADNESKRTDVSVGLTVGDQVEMLDGLSAGDKVLKVKP